MGGGCRSAGRRCQHTLTPTPTREGGLAPDTFSRRRPTENPLGALRELRDLGVVHVGAPHDELHGPSQPDDRAHGPLVRSALQVMVLDGVPRRALPSVIRMKYLSHSAPPSMAVRGSFVTVAWLLYLDPLRFLSANSRNLMNQNNRIDTWRLKRASEWLGQIINAAHRSNL